MIVGIDLDNTISDLPEFFGVLAAVLVDAGHEVHVITYRPPGTYDAVRAELEQLGVGRASDGGKRCAKEYLGVFEIRRHPQEVCPMQVIGRPCARCGDSIVSVLEASWCSACDVTFHQRCIDESERCPECERSFAKSRQADLDRGKQETDALLRSGRNLVLFATILFGSSRAVLIALSFLGAEIHASAIARDGALALVGLVLLVAAYLGLRWVRIYVQLCFGLSIVLQIVLLLSLAQADVATMERTLGMVLVGLILAVDAFVLYTFLFSQRVRRFIEYQEFENVR